MSESKLPVWRDNDDDEYSNYNDIDNGDAGNGDGGDDDGDNSGYGGEYIGDDMLPSPIAAPKMTLSVAALTEDQQLRIRPYIEPPEFGHFMKPGKAPSKFGPLLWPAIHELFHCVLACPCRACEFPLGLALRYVEMLPFSLPCGTCRMESAVNVVLANPRKTMRTRRDVDDFFSGLHNSVSLKFNANPLNEALPPKPIYDAKLHHACYGEPIECGSATRQFRFGKRLFPLLYFVAGHYPDEHLDQRHVRLFRLRSRIYLALYAYLVPARWPLSECLAPLGLGARFASVCRSDAPLAEVEKAAEAIPPLNIWRDSERLYAALFEMELRMHRAYAAPVQPDDTLATRKRLVESTVSTPPIPIVLARSS